MRLALVQSDLARRRMSGSVVPVDREQWAFDAADFPAGLRQLILAGIRGELAQDLAGPHGPAEFERELIRERTLAGLKAARARGRKGGRARGRPPQGSRVILLEEGSDPS